MVFYHFYKEGGDISSFHIDKAFAEDPGGNFICFDYRKGVKKPEIVFVSHEEVGDEAVHFICDDFSKFLSSLPSLPLRNSSVMDIILRNPLSS